MTQMELHTYTTGKEIAMDIHILKKRQILDPLYNQRAPILLLAIAQLQNISSYCKEKKKKLKCSFFPPS